MKIEVIFCTLLFLLKFGTCSSQIYQYSVTQNECKFEVLINITDSSLTYKISNLSKNKYLVFFEGCMSPTFGIFGNDTTMGMNNFDLRGNDDLYLSVILPKKSYNITYFWRNISTINPLLVSTPDSVLYRYFPNFEVEFGYDHVDKTAFDGKQKSKLHANPDIYYELEKKIYFKFINNK